MSFREQTRGRRPSAFFIESTPSSSRASISISRRSSYDSSDDDDFSSLPFPQPLARSAFTAPDFSAAEYLSSLRSTNRHQTLEDLRGELRNRSKDLEKELVELINSEYVDFVGLGGSLKGGEGKAGDLKVGVMGFAREVEGVRGRLLGVLKELEMSLAEKKEITKKKTLARNLLAFSNHLSTLEALLFLDTSSDTVSMAFLFEADAEEGAEGNILTTLPRLKKLVSMYLHLRLMLGRLPSNQPFVVKQTARILLCKKTILEDLASATRECQEKKGDSQQEVKLLSVLMLWGDMGESAAALKVLRENKGTTKKYTG